MSFWGPCSTPLTPVSAGISSWEIPDPVRRLLTLPAIASTYELGLDGLASYCEALDVNNMNHEFFVLSDIVQAQGFGHVTRQGFVKGWKQAWEESEGQVEPNMASHRKHVRSQIGLVRSDPAVFGKVYRSTFTTGKELGQRELEMGQALTFWGMLFEPSMKSWHSTHVNWLAVWTDYLREKFGKETVDEDGETEWVYSRSVSRDLWNQTRLFAAKTMEDETLGFWSEEQAWPGLVDEFVVWCQEKGKVAPRNADRMEVEG